MRLDNVAEVGAEPPGIAGTLPSAARANSISTEALKKVLTLVQSCPYDKDTYSIMMMNVAGRGRPILTRNAVSPA